MALVAFGHAWAQAAKVALERADGDNSGFYDAKLVTARYFMQRLLPQTASLARTACAGAETVMALDAEMF